jgi:hypothetical protein
VPAPPKRHPVRNVLIGSAAVLGLLFVLGTLGGRDDVGDDEPGPAPRSLSAPAPAAAAPLRMNLTWRDDALRYAGTLNWDGQSSVAQLSVVVNDAATGASLGSRQLEAAVQADGKSGVLFSTGVAVAGDTQTPGAHTHAVNLFFQVQPTGGWVFVRNCVAADRCWAAGS